MRILFPFLALLLFYCQSFCGIGDWKSFTSKRNIRDITFLQNKIWAVSDGGMFTYNLSDSSFQEFSPVEGLKKTDLKSIGVDNSGKIWIGSSGGYLLSYQPTKSKWGYYNDIYILAAPEKAINNLSAYGDTLFISSDVGVSVFNIKEDRFNDTYIKYGMNPQISGNVKSLLINNDTIWIATDKGIASAWRYQTNLVAPQSWMVFQTTNGLPSNSITSISVFNNILFASTANGLAQFDGINWQIIQGTSSLNIINSISMNSGLCFITSQRLYKLNNDFSIELLKDFQNLTLTDINISDGKIFLGTSTEGIKQFANSVLEKNILPPGPPTNTLVGLAVDNVGDLWAGTGTRETSQGFVRFDEKKWHQYNVDNYPALGSPTYYRVDIGYNNSKWISGWGKGVALVNNQNEFVKVLSKSNGLPPTLTGDTNYVVVAGVATDKAGKAWINVRTGRGDTLLVVYKPDSTLEYIKSPISFVGNDIAIGDNGTKWISARNEDNKQGGLYFYNESDTIRGMFFGSRWGRVSKANGLSSDNISVVAVDNEGEIWAGTTDAGINIIFDPNNPLNRIALYYPLRDQKINDILVDPLNQKWVATSKGAYVLSPDGTSILNQYTVESTDGRLLDDNVLSIAMNGQSGVVYLGTDKGISVLQTTSVTPVNSFGKIIVSPNPFVIPSNKSVIFDGLVRNSTIKILTVDGKLIKEIITPGGKVGLWDGTDSDGSYVSSGIYIVAAYSEDGNEVGIGKIAVVRK
jgi:ligand-binding sensor domain-containing protein